MRRMEIVEYPAILANEIYMGEVTEHGGSKGSTVFRGHPFPNNYSHDLHLNQACYVHRLQASSLSWLLT